MSFEFEWPRYFSASFYDSAKASLEQALNSGQKLSLVADKIRVVDLNLGSIPPELDLLAIDELSAVDGSFKGRFMLSYSGDALISLATNLHVNPLTQYKHALEMLATPSVLLTTAEMFVQLTLSHLRLRCVISLSFSKTSGLAMTFRDDPLESLNVSSSFDSFGVVQQFIQSEIENQLRERFRRDLPSLIHRLSQRWCADMAQQAVATNNQTPIVVEQIIHTPVSETGPVGREPDDSLPYDFAGNPAHMRPRAASRSFGTSPSKSYLGDRDSNDIDDEAIQFDSDSDSSERYDESAQERSNVSFPNRSGRSFFDETRLSQDYQDMSVYPDENKSRSSSWSSTWSRESTADGLSPPRPSPPGNGSRHRLDRESGTDSPIISSLKRSTSNFATTFSKAPVPVSVQDLRKSLNGSERHLQQERQTGMRRRSHNSQRNGTSFQADSNASKQDVSETRMPLATRKRLHRLEGTTPKATPNNSPHKSRILKGAKSRDRLRIHRKDLDEYFPVTDEGSSTTTAMNDNVFTSSRSARPSLLNPDVPMQIPMAASLMHSSKSDFPSKNSLRRTIMSSRLRDLERVSGSGPSSSRRPPADHNFFTSNSYS